MSKLASREEIPAKILIFHDDLRPGYFGTWTRSSCVIGARTPFAKDVVALDYGYDSGLEWDEEDANGDNVDEEGEDEDGEGVDESDSDLDSWLVDDDEVEEAVGEQRELSPSAFLDVPLPPKRRQKEPENPRKLEKKRKVVSPLLPFAKGPCWEEEIGSCAYGAFKSYKIHLFNGLFILLYTLC
jgi:chromatin assembly factor 1 subunit A